MVFYWGNILHKTNVAPRILQPKPFQNRVFKKQ